jgi:hypothetical protein
MGDAESTTLSALLLHHLPLLQWATAPRGSSSIFSSAATDLLLPFCRSQSSSRRGSAIRAMVTTRPCGLLPLTATRSSKLRGGEVAEGGGDSDLLVLRQFGPGCGVDWISVGLIL